MSVIRFRKLFPYRRGQVATYLVVWIAVLVVMGIVLLNIGQVVLNKNLTSIAADSAALGLASNLGSISRKLCANLGTKDCQPKCSDNWEFVLHAIIAAIEIAVAIIILIYSWGSAVAGSIALIILAIAAIVALIFRIISLALEYAVIQPHQIDVFNQMMTDMPLHDQTRESALLSAFAMTVDDTRQVVDDDPVPGYKDINRNGDLHDMVGVFSKWWYRRIVILHGRAGNLRRYANDLMKIQLPAFRDASKKFRNQFLGHPYDTQASSQTTPSFIGMLDWLEKQGLPVTFWQPGFQGPVYATPSVAESLPDSRFFQPCDPGAVCAPPTLPPLFDDVDWVNGEIQLPSPPNTIAPDRAIDGSLKAFEKFVDLYSAYSLRHLVRSSNQWGTLLRGYWGTNASWWSQFLQKWIDELRITESTMCSRYGLATNCKLPTQARGGPPPFPVAAGFNNPIEWAINRLAAFKVDVDALSGQISVAVVKGVSKNHPIYKWRDTRGWHAVRVEIPSFNVPTVQAKSGIVWTYEDRGGPECSITGFACMSTCVGVESKEGNVTVKVTRLDQDQPLNRMWDFRVRDQVQAKAAINWDDPGTMDAESPKGRQYWDDILKQYGITSEARAHFSYKPRTVQMRKVE